MAKTEQDKLKKDKCLNAKYYVIDLMLAEVIFR